MCSSETKPHPTRPTRTFAIVALLPDDRQISGDSIGYLRDNARGLGKEDWTRMSQAVVTQPVLLGLIGSPIKSSAAPFMHETAAEAAGLRAHYRLIDIPGADQAKLRALLEGVRLLGFSGINVTFPYKEAVV